MFPLGLLQSGDPVIAGGQGVELIQFRAVSRAENPCMKASAAGTMAFLISRQRSSGIIALCFDPPSIPPGNNDLSVWRFSDWANPSRSRGPARWRFRPSSRSILHFLQLGGQIFRCWRELKSDSTAPRRILIRSDKSGGQKRATAGRPWGQGPVNLFSRLASPGELSGSRPDGWRHCQQHLLQSCRRKLAICPTEVFLFSR